MKLYKWVAVLVIILGVFNGSVCLIGLFYNSNAATASDYYIFSSFADGSPVYIRKDCICTITTVSGDVYVVPTNGQSVRVKESMEEVKDIVGLK